MANIVVYRDPAGIKAPETYYLKGETNFAEWLLDNLAEGSQGLHMQVVLNGSEIVNTETMSVENCCKASAIKIGQFDNVTIRFRPQGVDPFTLAIIAIVAIGAAALTIALAPKPKTPGQVDAEGRDGNNQLNSASNNFRPRQAIPDIAGQVISFPDFIQPSYFEYVNNQRVFREIFCFGVGQYVVEDVKEGDTPLDDILQSEYQIYNPGETPADLLNVRTAQSSVDLDLLGADQQTRTGYLESIDGAQVSIGNILSVPESFITLISLAVGNTVDFEVQYLDAENNLIIQTGTNVAVLNINAGDILLNYSFASTGAVTFAFVTNNAFQFDSPWFVLEGDQITEVWFNLVMPQGIRKGDGTTAQVSATLEAQPIDINGDTTGPAIQRGATFSGNTLSAQRQTFKLTSSDGITPGRYRARATRITNSLGDNAVDLLTLEGVSSVTPYTADFGNVTLLEVIRRSNQRANRGASNKINAKVTRKLQTFTSGGAFVPTRSFADYVYYLLSTKAGVPDSQINTDELFGIYSSLSDAQLGYFDFTFDDGNISLRERIETACNVARVRYWNEGLLWSFVREEAKPFKSLMFNRRNLAPGAGSFTQKFRRPADYDSVVVIYVDPVKNAEKRVGRKINGSGNIEPGLGIRPLEIRLAGCRNDLQALNRCELEVRRLIYQSVKVKDTALMDGQLARLGMRVDWVDQYDLDMFDGELLSVSGNQYKTSERFEPEPGVDYWVYITDQSGEPSNSVRAYPRADGNIFGFQADGLTGAFFANGKIQSGSRYFICSDEDAAASTFTVIGRGRPNDRGECEIELAEYNSLMFSAD